MTLQLTIGDPSRTFTDAELGEDTTFVVSGLVVEGAAWNGGRRCLELSDALRMPLPQTLFRWVLKSDASSAGPQPRAVLPMYSNHHRRHVVMETELSVDPAVPLPVWQQRCVALIVWTEV
jgi:Dynein heavy chain C-terminal domain